MYQAKNVAGRKIVITGANSGIGRAAARALANAGAEIVLVCRDRARGEAARQDLMRKTGRNSFDLMLCDMACLKSIRAFGEEYARKHDRIDVLVNNAGALNAAREETSDGFERTFGTNHLGYFATTWVLRDVLAQSKSRIVNVASDAHRRGTIDFSDLEFKKGYSGWRAYSRSKLCNILFTYSLARRFERTLSGCEAHAMHPGFVRSGFGGTGVVGWGVKIGQIFARNSAKGAETIVWLACEKDLPKQNGGYYFDMKVRRTLRICDDVETQDRLWRVSEQMTGMKWD